jgi:hypothetical protein
MRYFSYNEYDPDNPLADSEGGYVVTYSENEIREKYWPYWYSRMCQKYEQAYVDEYYSFEDCLCDWIAVYWAWEVKG